MTTAECFTEPWDGMSPCESASCDMHTSTFRTLVNQCMSPGHLCYRCYITKAISQLKRNKERLFVVDCRFVLLL